MANTSNDDVSNPKTLTLDKGRDPMVARLAERLDELQTRLAAAEATALERQAAQGTTVLAALYAACDEAAARLSWFVAAGQEATSLLNALRAPDTATDDTVVPDIADVLAKAMAAAPPPRPPAPAPAAPTPAPKRRRRQEPVTAVAVPVEAPIGVPSEVATLVADLTTKGADGRPPDFGAVLTKLLSSGGPKYDETPRR